MPFPRRLLIDGETVALDLRPHWWFFVGPVAAGIPLIAVLIVVLRLKDDAQTAGWYVFSALSLFWALWLISRLARWATTHFVVTSDRIIFRTGVFAKHGRNIPLERINDIASSQTFFERLIGAGDLLIESAGERGQQTFTDVANPDHVQQEIYRRIEANVSRGATGGRAAQDDRDDREIPVTQQIAALADLRDRGAITETEFQTKKAELLGRL
ncbi:MAG: PH domain-containing protein [Acidimicrobiia bacterium]